MTDSVAHPIAPLENDSEDMSRIARAAFVAMPIAAFMLDDQMRVVLHTRRAGRIYHHPAREPVSGLEGVDFVDLTHLEPLGLQKALRTSISSGSITLPMKDAHRIHVPKDVIFHLSLMRIDGVSRPLYMLSQDHLRASAEALRAANIMREKENTRGLDLEAHISSLQNSVMTMETFAHAVSHDLKSPINALSGLLNLFNSKFGAALPAESEPFLSHMQNAVVQMDMLTTKLLAHAQSATAPLEMQKVDLRAAMDRAVSMIDPAIRAQAQDIATDGPNMEVMAEPTLLQTLLGNIVGNALKHGAAQPDLRITLDLKAKDEGAVLTIRDNGNGFDPAQADAIFTPFLRLNSDIEGSGVGLATCAAICKRHNWQISADSDGKTGARFAIQFPRVLLV